MKLPDGLVLIGEVLFSPHSSLGAIPTSFTIAFIPLEGLRASPFYSRLYNFLSGSSYNPLCSLSFQKLIASHSSHDSTQLQLCLPCRLSSKFNNLSNSNTLISTIKMANSFICSLIEPSRDSSKTLMPSRKILR